MLSELYIRSVEIVKENISIDINQYPLTLPVVKNTNRIVFKKPVTFFVGENGTGKSTILEAIAVSYGFNPEGGSKNFAFSTKDSHSKLYSYTKLVKGTKLAKDGFFLRAESFYNVATEVDTLDTIDPTLISAYGGISLHSQSHGESFMS